MPASISIYLDSTTIDDVAHAAWAAAISETKTFELVASGPPSQGRASNLHRALRSAKGDCFVWLDCRARPTLEPLEHAWQTLRDRGAASASLTAVGESLTTLGVRVPLDPADSGGPRLFAPARAALYHRGVLLDAGGFDPSLVEGHEDADAGWRLALSGERTIAIPILDAVPLPTDQTRAGTARRLRHLTANELATLFLCAGDDWLRRALPAALARLMTLAAFETEIDPRTFDFGREIQSTLPLPIESLARLLAIDDFGRGLDTLRARRARLQSRRRRSDEQLLPLFQTATDADWCKAAGAGAEALCDLLGITTRPAAVGSNGRSELLAIANEGTPSVSIVILTLLGATHLPACLDSLAKLEYPKESIEVIVVDNASASDPSPVVEQHYPGARVLRQERNLGFCGGNNAGARAARHEWLLFLNDDTRVEPGLVRALVQTAQRRGAALVGAFVTDWDGREVDFAGGWVNFEGRGFQQGVGGEDLAAWRVERPVLFTNGAATFIRRDVYAAAGGFPDRYFAYYEDVALGWAVWMLGYEVWLSAGALVYHRHHGSSATAAAARERHCARNALITLMTHLSAEALPDVLGAALLMAATRTVLGAGLGGFREDDLTVVRRRRVQLLQLLNPTTVLDHFRGEMRRRGAKRVHGFVGSLARVGVAGVAASLASVVDLVRTGRSASARVADRSEWRIPSESAATLIGIGEWCHLASESAQARLRLQQQRRRLDSEVLSPFGDSWLSPVPIDADRHAEYRRVHRAVIKQFQLELAQSLRRSNAGARGTV